jgi:ubiquinone/menaquinone biosynthesis C-methylase UbiE
VTHQLGLFLMKLVPDSSERDFLVSRLGELLRCSDDNLVVVEGLADSYERVQQREASDSSRRASKRSKDRAQDVVRLFMQLPSTPESILDVGCGDGSILRAIGRRFPSAALLATDLHEPDLADGFEFRQSTDSSIPFEDGAADAALLFMSAHHFENLEATLGEIRRVLAPDGRIVLRDHDFRSEADHVFMDVVHMFYACIAGDEESPSEFLKSFWSNYHSQAEWVRIFEKNGFVVQRTVKFNKRDLFCSFYAVFRKRMG